jgi:high-affinity iron transporter
MRRPWRPAVLGSALALVAVLWLALASLTSAASPEEDLSGAQAIVRRAIAAAQAGDLAKAASEYRSYDNTWLDVEDPIRAKSRESYREIEARMAEIETALAAKPVDQAALVAALSALDREQQLFVEGKPPTARPGSAPAAPAAGGPPTMGLLLDQLAAARAAQARGDYAGAAAQLKAVQNTWLEVEGQVKTRSAEDYRQFENDMALAYAQLTQTRPESATVLERMATRLEPYRAGSRYGVFDATVILLREGLEALLILVALLAFLRKSGNAAKSAWIWGGSGAGVAASLVVGVMIQLLFSSLITPSNREMIEGAVGLVAAAMLLYVSYWLHSKSSLGAWQQYLRQQTTTALATGSVFGLALLSFLAVFREGAETVLFFLGMTGNIAASDLALGLAIGTGLLVILGVLLLGVGVRVPMRPFFAVAGLLVFYLCVKFTGTGVHALQIGGVLPATAAGYLPEVGWLGMYSTWESTLPQLALLAVALAVVLRDRLRPARAPAAAHAS